MLSGRPRLLVIDDHPARRLESTATLAPLFDAFPLAHDEDPLRAARTRRPDIALVTLARRDAEAGLRLVRTLRTDPRPVPRVGVLEHPPYARGPWVAMELWMADGWLGLPADAAALRAFTEALWRGDRPVRRPPAPERGALGRLLDRLRGR